MKEYEQMKIMVFLHGTAIMHQNAKEVSREVRVRQVLSREESIYDYASYIPIGNVVEKLVNWKDQGNEIIYLSSHKNQKDVEKDKVVLEKYDFPKRPILFRQGNETYEDVIERSLPDILIEDDCESIGGEKEMTYPSLRSELKARIKSIVVREFGGIDHLPNSIDKLINYES